MLSWRNEEKKNMKCTFVTDPDGVGTEHYRGVTEKSCLEESLPTLTEVGTEALRVGRDDLRNYFARFYSVLSLGCFYIF